jgi:hypothetical protein
MDMHRDATSVSNPRALLVQLRGKDLGLEFGRWRRRILSLSF